MSVTSAPKILHVVISMTVGGAEKLVYDMVRHDCFLKRKPVVCCLDGLGELGEKLQDEGYGVFVKGRKSGLDWSVVAWLRSVILREDIEVVHAHQYTPLFYTTLAALTTRGVKVIYTEHGRFFPDRKSWKRWLVNPVLALRVDQLVSISAATARAMSDNDHLPLSRIRVIHNGIDLSPDTCRPGRQAKLAELGIDPDSRIIGTAARLDSIKNIPMMIRSLPLILSREPGVCLVIAGQGPEENALKDLARELNVGDKVKFIGLRFDLDEIYPLFEVFLLTSYSEGISVTLLEAMANAVPAVVTDVGGNVDVVVDGETGYLVAVDDDDSLSQRVVDILRNQSLGQSMGEAALSRVHERFSFQKMVDAYWQLYTGTGRK